MAPKTGPSLHGHAGLPTALATLSEAIAPIVAVWPQLTPTQRQDMLAHSPTLAGLLALVAPLTDMGV